MTPFVRWLTGLGTSLIGNHIFLVALTWAAVQTATPGQVGAILLAGSVPRAVLLLIGGVFVDRVGPKKIMMISDAGRVAMMIVFALVLLSGHTTPLLLGVLAVVFGVIDGFFLPAVSVAPSYLAGDADLTRMTAARTVVARAAELVGAPLGSVIVAAAGAVAAFWSNSVLFALSVLALGTTRMRRPTAAELGGASTSVWRDLVGGVRTVAGQPTVATLLIVVAVTELGFSGPLTVGVPLLSHQLGWGVAALGWVFGGFGGGAAITAAVLALRGDVERPGLGIGFGLVAMGGAILGLGSLPAATLTPQAALATAGGLGMLAGLGAGVYGTLATTAVLRLAPADQRGRVMSALAFSSLAMFPITFALTGLLTSVAGAQAPFWIGGGLILASAALALSRPRVRRLRREQHALQLVVDGEEHQAVPAPGAGLT